jgi:hypothetical protein
MTINAVKNLVMKLWSSWNGRRMGDFMFTKGCPFVTGKIINFLPLDVQTEQEKDLFRFSVWKHVWTGWGWKRTELLVLTREQLKDAITKSEYAN